jgi:hypothetical protein
VRSVSTGLLALAGVLALSGAIVGCGSSALEPWQVSNGSHDSGATSGDDGGTFGPDGGATGDDGGSGNSDATGSDTGGGGSDSSTQDSSSGVDAGVDTGTVTSADGFGPSRTACINKINALRATDKAIALQPYTLQNTATLDTCVDTQATNDQSKNSAHDSFINNSPSCQWGSASGFAQDECLTGYGTSPAGIEQCLQDMWDESLKPNCAGCVGCTAFGGACANCDYSGTGGYECGHYVNMSAPYFTMVACGFAGAAPSSGGGWSVQNFE